MPVHEFVPNQPIVVDYPIATGVKRPAVLLFPGRGGRASTLRQQLPLTGLDVYKIYYTARTMPDGQTAWRIKNYAEQEAEYIDWTLSELSAIYSNIDMNELYCMGQSNGGEMAYSYVSLRPNKVRSVIGMNTQIVQGKTSFAGDVLHIHTKNDDYYPYYKKKDQYNIDRRTPAETIEIFERAGATVDHIAIQGKHSVDDVKRGLQKQGNTINSILYSFFNL